MGAIRTLAKMSREACFRCGRNASERAVFCPACLSVLLSSCDDGLSDFLESLGAPAALISSDRRVLGTNSRLCRMHRKYGHDIVGLRIGQALGCRHAQSDGRCGEIAVCFHCGLMRLIEVSRISGESLREIPVEFLRQPGAVRTLRVTATKVGEGVLVLLGT